jgi:hypothetical protein
MFGSKLGVTAFVSLLVLAAGLAVWQAIPTEANHPPGPPEEVTICQFARRHSGTVRYANTDRYTHGGTDANTDRYTHGGTDANTHAGT